MSFVYPAFFYVGAAVATAVFILHLLVTKQPPSSPLPTLRFVPDRVATTTAVDYKPTDVLVMLTRMLLALAVGAALARPIITPSHTPTLRLIVLDASRATKNPKDIGDSAATVYRDGDAVILFDSAARVVESPGSGTFNSFKATDARGNLTAALIVALREASRLKDAADSMELTIISPLMNEELDGATETVRKKWPGRIRLVHVAGRVDTAQNQRGIDLQAKGEDDPMSVVSPFVATAKSPVARVVRGDMTTADAQWASVQGRAVVGWPLDTRPPFAVPRAKPDSIGGVAAGEAPLVAPMARQWSYPAESLAKTIVVARWIDGEPAAIERANEQGCVRSVAVPISGAGDQVLRPDFLRFLQHLTGPCGNTIDGQPMPPRVVEDIAGMGPLASSTAFQSQEEIPSPWVPWLLGLGLVMAALETYLRRGRKKSEKKSAADSDARRRAA